MNWPEALTQLVREYMDQPLQWGVRDCCQFAAAYVALRTGVNHAKAFTYHNRLGADNILEAFGGIEQVVSSVMGPSHSDSEPGDLVLCAFEDFEAVGVTNGAYVWTIHPTMGLCRVEQKSVRCAWSP